MINFDVLTEVLDSNANELHDITYIRGQNKETSVRFSDLRQRALGILFHFQNRGLQPGDELILLTDNNEFFIDVFWACLYGGIVPVPVAVGISDEHRFKLARIFNKLTSPYIYTEQSLLDKMEWFFNTNELASEAKRIVERSITIESINDIASAGAIHKASPDDAAFIQFSSGSTSKPKGVVLTHKNVLTNIKAIIGGTSFTSDDTYLSWMPLTHDMGLIGFHLTPLALNGNHTIMDTSVFVRRPLSWLSVTSEKKFTILSSPNFGFKHFLKVFESRGLPDLDLSHVRLIVNGAEPISAQLCNEFLDAMSRFGLKRNVMFPVYGLAEASLAVSFPDFDAEINTISANRQRLGIGEKLELVKPDDINAMTFVTVGRPVNECGVRIADTDGKELAEGFVGRILLKGNNVTNGYYLADDINSRIFDMEGWLDTGDLGLFHEGELVVTGRVKDVIFVNGQNFYSHDIENIIHQLDELELGKVVAAGARKLGDEEDELIVFILYRGTIESCIPLMQKVRKLVNETTGVEVKHVLPIQRIPKTTSGKVQRHKLADQYRDGECDTIVAEIKAFDTSRGVEDITRDLENSLEAQLSAICHLVVTDKTITPDDNLFEIGISSLALAEIHEKIDEQYPGLVDITDVFDYPTVNALARFIQEKIQAD